MYLVHWPPIALYRAYTLSELSYGVSALLAVITVLLTVLLHYQVERRFYRRGAAIYTGWRGVPLLSATAALLFCASLYVVQIQADHVSQRQVVLSSEAIKSYKGRRYQLKKRHCHIDHLADEGRCPTPQERNVLFIGNSHEVDGFNILAAALPTDNRQFWVLFGNTNACDNLEATAEWATSSSAQCQSRLDKLRASLETNKWQTIIYSARRPAKRDKLPVITMLEAMKRRFPSLSIVVIDDYITTKESCGSLINQWGSALACKDPRYVEFFPGMHPSSDIYIYRDRLNKLATAWVSKTDLLCSSSNIRDCEVTTPDGHPIFVDRHHLTFEFATYVGGLLQQQNPSWLATLSRQH